MVWLVYFFVSLKKKIYMSKKRYFKVLICQPLEVDPEGKNSIFVPVPGDHSAHALSRARFRCEGSGFYPDPDNVISILSSEFFSLKRSLLEPLEESLKPVKVPEGDKYYRFLTQEKNGQNSLCVCIRTTDPGSAILAARAYYPQPSIREFVLSSITEVPLDEYLSICDKGYYFPV